MRHQAIRLSDQHLDPPLGGLELRAASPHQGDPFLEMSQSGLQLDIPGLEALDHGFETFEGGLEGESAGVGRARLGLGFASGGHKGPRLPQRTAIHNSQRRRTR